MSPYVRKTAAHATPKLYRYVTIGQTEFVKWIVLNCMHIKIRVLCRKRKDGIFWVKLFFPLSVESSIKSELFHL